MDITDLIKSQIEEAVSIDGQIIGLESVQTHIERAEYLLNLGKKNSDDHLYTDVIYRTNHAFEGILKEAHTVLTGKDSSKKTPQQIEDYLLRQNILNQRVVELLKNYRQEWRNTSTHDYNLFFDYGEAFLAIVNVSAFVHVLLNQIITSLVYDKEKERLKEVSKVIKDKLGRNYQKLTFEERITSLFLAFDYRPDITLFSSEDNKNSKGLYTYSRQILSSLNAYLNSTDKTISVNTEPVVTKDGKKLHPDFILTSKKGERALVEVKLTRFSKKFATRKSISFYESQLVSLMTYSGIETGVLLMLPKMTDEELVLTSHTKEIKIGESKLSIIMIYQDSEESDS